jgi:hypothetical protein
MQLVDVKLPKSATVEPSTPSHTYTKWTPYAYEVPKKADDRYKVFRNMRDIYLGTKNAEVEGADKSMGDSASSSGS